MNKLDALAKEKFNGDLKAAWDYVLYEMSPEERDEITKYVSKKQLDIGMTAIRRKDPDHPNELDELANSKFNGDLKAAWDYVFSNCSPEEIDRYVSAADAHQAAMAFLLVDSLKEPKSAKRSKKITRVLENLQITREELLNMQKNPYSPPLRKSTLKVVLVFAAITGLIVYSTYMGMDDGVFEAGMSILGIALSYFIYDLVDVLRNYLRFRFAKKALEKESKQISSKNPGKQI